MQFNVISKHMQIICYQHDTKLEITNNNTFIETCNRNLYLFEYSLETYNKIIIMIKLKFMIDFVSQSK